MIMDSNITYENALKMLENLGNNEITVIRDGLVPTYKDKASSKYVSNDIQDFKPVYGLNCKGNYQLKISDKGNIYANIQLKAFRKDRKIDEIQFTFSFPGSHTPTSI